MGAKLVYLVTEDWYFLSHRLPMARAARDAGFEVHALARVGQGRAAIEAEGFTLHALDWQRADKSPVKFGQAVAQVRGHLIRIDPAVLHNVALKPAFVGGLAARGLAKLSVVNNINGLGSGYLSEGLAGRFKRFGLGQALAFLLNRPRTMTVAQNPEDLAKLLSYGIAPQRLRLIAGSGIDTQRLTPSPEPPGPTIVVTYVGRMLADKGLRTLMAAHRLVRQQRLPVQLQLAGTADPDNASSIPAAELESWVREPGVAMLGHVTDIGALWAKSHIAVLPSRREGLPLSLLEASACGRAMIATDVPGCRDVVRDGETGLLVPLEDPVALAAAIGRLASDAALRQKLGATARLRAETEFSAEIVAAQIATLYREMAVGGVA